MTPKKNSAASACYSVAVVSDTHLNSTVALSTPQVLKDDGAVVTVAPEIRWLWARWLDFWEFFGEVTKSCGGRPLVVFNGDIVDVDAKRYSGQIHTRNIGYVMKNAVNALLPAIDQVEGAFFIRGTEAHTGKNAQAEENLADDFSVTIKNPDRPDQSTWWELRREIGGVKFDISHHASMGRRPYTEKNAANQLAFLVYYYYLHHGLTPPDIAIRGHIHRQADSFDNFPVRGMFTGAWQLKTAFVHRLGTNGLADLGGNIYICQGGEAEVIKRYYEPAKGSQKWQKIEKILK